MGSGDLAHTGPSRSRQRPFSSAEATGRHPRRFRSSWSPVTAARTRSTAILPPEVAEAGRRKFGIANRVLDVLVPEPRLQRPRVMTGIGQREAAAVPQPVRKNGEGHTGAPAEALEQRAEAWLTSGLDHFLSSVNRSSWYPWPTLAKSEPTRTASAGGQLRAPQPPARGSDLPLVSMPVR